MAKNTKKAKAPTFTPLAVPGIGKPRPVKLPTIADEVMPNGLRVLAARRPGIPRFESRLVIPIARDGDAGNAPRLRMLTETVLSGTADRTSRSIAEELQGMGAGLGSYADAEQLLIGGSCLSSFGSEFLGLFGELVQQASFPAEEVAIERERVVQEIALMRSQPGVVANDALLARLYGSHPYGQGTPDPDAIARVQPAALRKLHRARVQPGGSLLVLVGDIDLDTVLAAVEDAFGSWEAGAGAGALAVPKISTPSSVLLLDRPGAVQTTLRMAGAAIPRTDPHYPALTLAVTVLGGLFTSRLMDNIRESKGYTYGVSARVEHRRAASQLTISSDVGREVTAASLVEIAYELGRMVSTPVTQAELDAARRYLQGTLAMGIQTQSGLTTYLATMVSSGLPVSYLRDYPEALEAVAASDVLEVARGYLAPPRLTTVLVGDAATVGPAVVPLVEVEAAAAG